MQSRGSTLLFIRSVQRKYPRFGSKTIGRTLLAYMSGLISRSRVYNLSSQKSCNWSTRARHLSWAFRLMAQRMPMVRPISRNINRVACERARRPSAYSSSMQAMLLWATTCAQLSSGNQEHSHSASPRSNSSLLEYTMYLRATMAFISEISWKRHGVSGLFQQEPVGDVPIERVEVALRPGHRAGQVDGQLPEHPRATSLDADELAVNGFGELDRPPVVLVVVPGDLHAIQREHPLGQVVEVLPVVVRVLLADSQPAEQRVLVGRRPQTLLVLAAVAPERFVDVVNDGVRLVEVLLVLGPRRVMHRDIVADAERVAPQVPPAAP